MGEVLPGPGKGGLQQAGIAQSDRAAVQGQQAVMQREGIGFVNPGRRHRERVWRVLR